MYGMKLAIKGIPNIFFVLEYVIVIARSGVLYARYSTRGTVEEPIKHEAKPSALLVSRPYPSAVSRGTARTGHAISNLLLIHG